MRQHLDQTGRNVEIADAPLRIVSLVPSQTELFFDLGLDERVIGITKFCIHPEKWFREKTKVGGTKDFKPGLIESLQPDLIIANKEENEFSLLGPLMDKYPVWVSDVTDLESGLQMIQSIGEITGKEIIAGNLINSIQLEFDSLQEFIDSLQFNSRKVVYLIWNNPYMTIGADTFISDMLKHCGFQSLYENAERYPKISQEELKIKNPELVLLSSEPFPFSEKHAVELQNLLPGTKVLLADGEFFSWYGSRMLKAPAYFKSLIRTI